MIANGGCCNIFHITGTPMHIVVSLLGKSDHIAVLLLLLLLLVVVVVVVRLLSSTLLVVGVEAILLVKNFYGNKKYFV
jgi:hypothetical protein